MKKLILIVCIISIIFIGGCKSSQSELTDDENTTINGVEQTETSNDQEESENEQDEIKVEDLINQENIEELLMLGIEIDEISYVITFTSEENVVQSEYWQKGNLVKTIDFDASKGNVVTIYGENEMVVYYPDTKIGYKYPLDDIIDFAYDSMAVTEDYFIDTTYTFIENSKFDGKKCIVVKMLDADSNESKLWIGTENGLILKVEGYDEGGKFTSEITNVKIGNISKDTFVVPNDIIFEQEVENEQVDGNELLGNEVEDKETE